jgi:hypothetical protein
MLNDLPNLTDLYQFDQPEPAWDRFERKYGASTPVMRRLVHHFMNAETAKTGVPPMQPRYKTILASELIESERQLMLSRMKASIKHANAPLLSTIIIKPSYRGLFALFSLLASSFNLSSFLYFLDQPGRQTTPIIH